MHLSILHVYKLYMTINSSVIQLTPTTTEPQAVQHHRKCETNCCVSVSKSFSTYLDNLSKKHARVDHVHGFKIANFVTWVILV